MEGRREEYMSAKRGESRVGKEQRKEEWVGYKGSPLL
jgi:hypothetical protein